MERRIDMRDSRMNTDKNLLEGMLEDFAKNWLAHDGLWFQAVEKQFGLQKAIELDTEAWASFTVIEALRIMERHKIPPNGGLEALKTALSRRLYAVLNRQEIRNETDHSFDFYMVDCRVQSARRRKGMPLFPCRAVGLVEYEGFARTIDARIRTDCLGSPPDEGGGGRF